MNAHQKKVLIITLVVALIVIIITVIGTILLQKKFKNSAYEVYEVDVDKFINFESQNSDKVASDPDVSKTINGIVGGILLVETIKGDKMDEKQKETIKFMKWYAGGLIANNPTVYPEWKNTIQKVGISEEEHKKYMQFVENTAKLAMENDNNNVEPFTANEIENNLRRAIEEQKEINGKATAKDLLNAMVTDKNWNNLSADNKLKVLENAKKSYSKDIEKAYAIRYAIDHINEYRKNFEQRNPRNLSLDKTNALLHIKKKLPTLVTKQHNNMNSSVNNTTLLFINEKPANVKKALDNVKKTYQSTKEKYIVDAITKAKKNFEKKIKNKK